MDLDLTKIRKALEDYNRYRGVEAEAELIDIRNDLIKVRILGPFCETCGYYDWVEDLVYEMEDKGVDAEIVEIVDIEGGAEAKIRVKRKISQTSEQPSQQLRS